MNSTTTAFARRSRSGNQTPSASSPNPSKRIVRSKTLLPPSQEPQGKSFAAGEAVDLSERVADWCMVRRTSLAESVPPPPMSKYATDARELSLPSSTCLRRSSNPRLQDRRRHLAARARQRVHGQPDRRDRRRERRVDNAYTPAPGLVRLSQGAGKWRPAHEKQQNARKRPSGP